MDERLMPDRLRRELPRLSTDEMAAITRLYFQNFPDPAFVNEVREATRSPIVRAQLKRKLNEQRSKIGRPSITDRELDRLAGIFRDALGA